jgi:Family of unknown function (DUF695)/Regulator of ribonuclease activity B
MSADDGRATEPWATGPVLGRDGTVIFLKFTGALVGRQVKGYPDQVTVWVKILDPNENGQAGPEEHQELENIQASLVAGAAQEAYYLGWSNRAGWRSYLFHARTTDWFEAWVRAHQDEVNDRRISARVEDEPEWATYRELYAMAAEAMSDMQVFMQVAQCDRDISRPRRVDWRLIFTDEAEARAAVSEIESEGLDLTTELLRVEGRTVLSVSRVGVPDLGFVLYFNTMMRRVAAKNGAAFDGWGATLDAKDGPP